jgi:type IV secretion system protein TrbH
MRTSMLILILVLVLGGCVTKPYGSFIQNPLPEYSQVMADDVVAQIMRLYSAANTQFNLRHTANDPFGEALIENLRLEGFAVQEAVNPLFNIQATDNNPIVNAAHESDADQQKELALGYIIDQSDDLYHVNIMIDDMRLSRAFLAQADTITPAGIWVRKE